jgi:hypothetical protein
LTHGEKSLLSLSLSFFRHYASHVMPRSFFLVALFCASILFAARAEPNSVSSYDTVALTYSFPNEVSPSCKEKFTSEQLKKAREIFLICPDAGANAARECSTKHFADDIVYTDGSVVGRNRSEVELLFKNLLSEDLVEEWSLEVYREVCEDGLYVPFFLYNTSGWIIGDLRTNPIIDVPGVSFIKFNRDFKVYDWRDFFGEGKLYEHVPLIGNLLAEKKRCLFSFLGDEAEKRRCKDQVTQPIMAVNSDGSEETVPTEVSPSCARHFSTAKLAAARNGVHCSANRKNLFSEESVYTDGLYSARDESEIDETLTNMCSTYIYGRNWTITDELCTADGTYISRQFLNADPSFEGVSFVRVDVDSRISYRQDYLPDLKVYEKDAQIGVLLGRIVKGYVECLTTEGGCEKFSF